MGTKLARDMRLLKIYALVSSVGWVIMMLSAFAPHNRKQRFEEIDVQRINVVEKDGQIKLVISNRDRFPDPGSVVTGRYTRRVGDKAPGIVYYNDVGDECGGLIFNGKQEADGKYLSGALMTFDKFRGGQVMGLKYEEANGERRVGFNVWDQPDVSGEEQRAKLAEARNLTTGPERDALLRQTGGFQRVFIARGTGKAATLVLSDGNGRPRIRMAVAEGGASRLEFLDAAGKVIETLPRE
jgi:hypothetical protein